MMFPTIVLLCSWAVIEGISVPTKHLIAIEDDEMFCLFDIIVCSRNSSI